MYAKYTAVGLSGLFRTLHRFIAFLYNLPKADFIAKRFHLVEISSTKGGFHYSVPTRRALPNGRWGKHVRKGDIFSRGIMHLTNSAMCFAYVCTLLFPALSHKNAIFGWITRKKHRGQTAVYLSYIRVALGVSDEVRH